LYEIRDLSKSNKEKLKNIDELIEKLYNTNSEKTFEILKEEYLKLH